MADGKKFTSFFLLLGLLALAVPLAVGAAQQPDYQLRPGDIIRFNLWTWGNEPVQTLETTVRPDGKVAVAFAMIQDETYRLGAGDAVTISVWGYKEFENSDSPEKAQLIIRPDGKLSFPLVGEVAAAGLTLSELTQKMTLALSEYLKEPKVTVNVVKFRTMPLVREFDAKGLTLAELIGDITTTLKETIRDARLTAELVKFGTTRVYVLGEVTKPGLCEVERDHNLLDAIGAAGGFTKGANCKRVYLVRKGQTDHYTEINLDRMLKKGDLRQNVALNEGDVVYFTRNKINFAQDILPFITSLYYINHFNN
jgi:polysaccharide export outer membrane protein